jgi:hypothetical protein
MEQLLKLRKIKSATTQSNGAAIDTELDDDDFLKS